MAKNKSREPRYIEVKRALHRILEYALAEIKNKHPNLPKPAHLQYLTLTYLQKLKLGVENPDLAVKDVTSVSLLHYVIMQVLEHYPVCETNTKEFKILISTYLNRSIDLLESDILSNIGGTYV